MPKKNIADPPTAEQRSAWKYYGEPGKAKASAENSNVGPQVGEARYVIGWMADQMVRMGWRATIDGSETWEIEAADGVIISDEQEDDPSNPAHSANASRKLLETIEWDSRTVREVTTNLFVAGELHYALERGSDPKWRVVSVIRKDREDILENSSIIIHGLWPHPADPACPDAPMFGVLGVLDDMAWLNRLSRSQSANRVGMRGIIGVADGMTTSTGQTGEAFWSDFEASVSRPMDDPEDVAPVMIRGAKELVEPSSGGHGMAGLSWVYPDFPYDSKVDARMEKLVQRLAYGLPIPPEILLGLQAQSKATAFQVEGATYRAHIEPVALLVAKIATDALSRFLPDEVGKVDVIPDPTAILARRHSVSDVLEAFDRNAVGYSYLREVLGIPASAAPTEEDIALKLRMGGSAEVVDGVQDPANQAAEEPLSLHFEKASARAIAAAVGVKSPVDGAADEAQAPSPESEDDAWLSDRLHSLNTAILFELVGAVPQALAAARNRLAARVRANKRFKDQIPEGITNEEIPVRLGPDGFEALGIDARAVAGQALAPTITWWQRRVEEVRTQVSHLLSQGDVEVSFDVLPRASVDLLEELLHESVFAEAEPAEARLRDIIDLAGQ